MPFDPALPQENTLADAAQMRGQLNALNDKIDATPAGPPGPPGPQGDPGSQGPPFTSFMVDGVTTLNPGDNATVTANFDGNFVRIAFGIPRGATGADGAQGIPGEVSAQQLADGLAAALASAAANSSANTNAVATLDTPFADPAAEALRLKMNEMIAAMRRM